MIDKIWNSIYQINKPTRDRHKIPNWGRASALLDMKENNSRLYLVVLGEKSVLKAYNDPRHQHKRPEKWLRRVMTKRESYELIIVTYAAEKLLKRVKRKC